MISIGLVLVLASLTHAIVEVPPVSNSTHCVYLPESRVFSCKSEELTVECNAVANFSTVGSAYFLFGIEKVRDIFVDVPFEQVKFYLYPRSLDNSTYLNYTFELEGKFHDFVLYYGENFVDYGIRVIDVACYEKIVRWFRPLVDFHVISLTDVNVVPYNVSLIGEVLIHDKTVLKRWLYGYGYWGYPYYGWYGYPYSYWYGK